MIYLDNAASSHPKPHSVYEAVNRALRLGANPGRSGHVSALDAARLIFETRSEAADLLGVEDASRIIFTLNATHALNQALKGILNPGDHVVSTVMEHNSILRPLTALGKLGVKTTFVSADGEGRVAPGDIEKALTPQTRLVAMSHASNVSGTLQDVEAVGAVCKKHGVLFLLDAAQTIGVVPINVNLIGAHMVAAPGHKGLLGPQGTGLLYVAPGVELRPLMEGGTGVQSEDREMPKEMPESLEAGTLNTPGLAGLKAGIDYLLETGVENIRKKEEEILTFLLPELFKIPGITIYGPKDAAKRVAVVSFNLEGRDGAHLGYALDEEYGIAVRVGLHCAPDAHKAVGSFPAGAVRVSFGCFNTVAHAESLVRALRNIST